MIQDDQKVYYTSFENPIANQVKDFILKVDYQRGLYTHFQLQDNNTDTCGLYYSLILFILYNTI